MPFKKGTKFSKEHKERIGKSRLGIEPWNKGKNLPPRGPNYKIRGKNHYNWKGGVKTEQQKRLTSKGWARRRKERIVMDGERCQVCGDFPSRLEVHHIVPWRISHDDSLDNLMTTCCDCHRRLDRGWRNE